MKHTKKIFIIALIAISVVVLMPIELLAFNRFGAAVGHNYFSGTTAGSITGTVLPSYNYSGSDCQGYGSAAWQAAGSPTNTNNFAIPNAAVRSDGTQAQRKADVFNYLQTTYNQGSLASGATCLQRQKRIGAAFVVKTLLGIQSPTERSVTSAQWADLENRLSNPDISIFSTTRTSTFNSARVHNATTVIDVRHYNDPSNPLTEPTIVFRDNSTGQDVYELRRRCANPFGEGGGLPQFTPTYWNYTHDSFRVRNESNTSTLHNQEIAQGTPVQLQSRILNNGDGRGNSYELRIQRRIGSGTWSTVGSAFDPEGALNPSATRSRTRNYTIPNVANGTQICFRARITPYRGMSEPTLNNTGHPDGSGTGWLPSPVRCVTAYTAPGFVVTPGAGPISFASGSSLENPEAARFRGRITVSITYDNAAHQSDPVQIPIDPFRIRYFYKPLNGSAIDIGSSNFANSFGPGTYNRSTGTIALGSLNLSAGDQLCTQVVVNPTSGTVNSDGSLNVVVAETSSDEACVTIVDQPYVSAFGADVIATAGLADIEGSCTGAPGIISTLFDSSNNRNRGSGTQFAALAMTQINGFASAKMRTDAPTPTRGLSFSNDDSSAEYGGSHPITKCSWDYFAQMPSDIIEVSDSALTAANLNSSAYEYINVTNTTASAIRIATNVTEIRKNSNRTVYIEENDAFIFRNITFEDWDNLDEIPSFYLVVRGNIYIHSSVTQLDGIYIAQPDESGNGGNIYTCATQTGDGPVSAYSVTEMFNNCQNSLQVNGAFIANTLYLNRHAASSLRLGNQSEFPYGGNNPACDQPVCAAEIFNFSPEIYLNNPLLPPTSVPGQSRYDSITSLPPVL